REDEVVLDEGFPDVLIRWRGIRCRRRQGEADRAGAIAEGLGGRPPIEVERWQGRGGGDRGRAEECRQETKALEVRGLGRRQCSRIVYLLDRVCPELRERLFPGREPPPGLARAGRGQRVAQIQGGVVEHARIGVCRPWRA